MAGLGPIFESHSNDALLDGSDVSWIANECLHPILPHVILAPLLVTSTLAPLAAFPYPEIYRTSATACIDSSL